MSLTDQDKATVKALWCKISKSADVIGADALGRMLYVYPQTRSYFSHWHDMSPGSAEVKAHAKKVMGGIALAMTLIDNLTVGLAELSYKHALKLKVDPANFKLLCHCIHVVISMMYPKDFTPEVELAFDKFLCAVSAALADKYR